MAITTLCTFVAILKVLPNRSMFFEWESVSLSCGLQGNSSGWKLLRNTSKNINQEWFTFCHNDTNESHCTIDLIPNDSGDYWCESEAGECSEAVRITVTAGSVLLESPVLPVMEGDHVTMLCRTQKKSSGLTTDFYKDGVLIGSSSTRNLTIHSVSKSDEGFYKCNISGAGESPDVWLTVRAEKRAGRPEPLHSPLIYILLPVVVVCILLICAALLCLWRNCKGKEDPDVFYTDVIITQEGKSNRFRDIATRSTFYTKVKPGTA